jgi:hypothetical protein
MRMAGKVELSAFREQNRIRVDPSAVQRDIKEQMSWFDPTGKILKQP